MRAIRTEERLRYGLDGNHVDRERMCQALLALDSRFLDVRPRQPKGGPDQGRDLDARLADGRVVWAAIGFFDSVNNSPSDRGKAARKFKTDLARALTENPSLKAFVFMTNVSFTTTDRANLLKHAGSSRAGETGRKKARHRRVQSRIEFCDIFDGERLRILLDSPDGLGFRFQYLEIPLSEAEQAAFFARWGDQLGQLIRRQFTIFDQKLARLEFLLDCDRQLRSLSIELRLTQALSPAELGHFRLLLSIVAPGLRDDYSKLEIASRDAPRGQAGGFWITTVEKRGKTLSKPKRQIYSNFANGWAGDEISFLSARGGFSEWTSGLLPAATLGDLNENLLGIFVTKNLAPSIAEIRIVANDYVLLQIQAEDISTYEDPNGWGDLWPMELTAKEASIPWVRLDRKGGAIRLYFANSTPERLGLFRRDELGGS